MGLPVTGDATAFAGNSEADEAEEACEDESIVHHTASVGDVEVYAIFKNTLVYSSFMIILHLSSKIHLQFYFKNVFLMQYLLCF